jgi:hypothetical protein
MLGGTSSRRSGGWTQASGAKNVDTAECSETGSNAPEQKQGLAGAGLSPSVSVHAPSSQQRRMAPSAQTRGQVVITQSENRPARRGYLIKDHSMRQDPIGPDEYAQAES